MYVHIFLQADERPRFFFSFLFYICTYVYPPTNQLVINYPTCHTIILFSIQSTGIFSREIYPTSAYKSEINIKNVVQM